MLNRFKFARNREKLLARADVVFDAYRQGWIMPNIAVVLPLSEAAEVHRLLKTGKEFMAKVYEANDEAQDALETTIQANLNQAIDLVLKENRLVLEKVNYLAIAQLTQTITRSQRIFVAGEGRSGLVIRMVAMRLMHLGYQVYVVGETTTPSIVECDLLIDCSGSGTTEHVTAIARKAKEIGAKIVSVTTQEDSPLGKLADIVIKLEAAAKQDFSNQHSQQFAGSLFEQSTLLLFDAIFHVLSQNLHKSAETLWSRHTNLE